MVSPAVMGSTEIKTLIDDLVYGYAASAFSLYTLNHVGIAQIISQEFDDPNATAEFQTIRGDGKATLSLHDTLVHVRNNNEFNKAHTRYSLMTSITMLHDEMKNKGVVASPETHQFLRHLRNACGHGNRFHLLRGEPKTPAKFRSLEILSSHHGFENVFFEFLFPGDVFALFKAIQEEI